MAAVKTEKEYEVTVTGMNHEGQGVGRIDGLAVFIDNAIIDERVKIRITKLSKSYAVGELLEVLEASEDRREPFCTVYPACGGCRLQHMSYEAQLRFKTQLVRDSLKRIGGLEGIPVHEAIGMRTPLRYRNKAQIPFVSENGVPATGFYAKGSHRVVASRSCDIQYEVSDRIRKIAEGFIAENHISIYDEASGNGLIRHVMTRVGLTTGEIMVVVVINGGELPGGQKLVEMLVGAFPEDGKDPYRIRSIYVNINTRRTNVILGEKNLLIYGNKAIFEHIGGLKFAISPMSFFQVNPVQTEVLYEKALEYAQLTGRETVFDLYCGIGTISLFLSRRAGRVYGVETVEAAVADARENAGLNGVANAEFIAGEAETVVPRLYKQGVRADVVVVDPPRRGCDQGLLRTIAEMRPQRVVYVSCNPATLARDLAYLKENGYMPAEVQPIDMFPHTSGVECVVRLRRIG